MNKTFDFEEFVSNSLQAEMVQDDHMKQLTKYPPLHLL